MNANRYALCPPVGGAVQRVAGPQLVGVVGFEAAEHRDRGAVAAAVQVVAGEEPLGRAVRRSPSFGGGDDAADLCRGPGRSFPLQRQRQVRQRVRGRDSPFGLPPAQIPACAANALGSCLGYRRRSVGWGTGVSHGQEVTICWRGGLSSPS